MSGELSRTRGWLQQSPETQFPSPGHSPLRTTLSDSFKVMILPLVAQCSVQHRDPASPAKVIGAPLLPEQEGVWELVRGSLPLTLPPCLLGPGGEGQIWPGSWISEVPLICLCGFSGVIIPLPFTVRPQAPSGTRQGHKYHINKQKYRCVTGT